MMNENIFRAWEGRSGWYLLNTTPVPLSTRAAAEIVVIDQECQQTLPFETMKFSGWWRCFSWRAQSTVEFKGVLVTAVGS
jgi:hypothetical protein